MGYVCVVGDLILDRYIQCDAKRLDQTASVPVYEEIVTIDRLGGAGNVAANVAAMGVKTALVSCRDESPEILTAVVDAASQFVTVCPKVIGYTTPVKTRVTDKYGRLCCRIDRETPVSWTVAHGPVLTAMTRSFDSFVGSEELSVIVLSDYNKGVLSPALIHHVLSFATLNNIPVIVDPVPAKIGMYAGATMLKPNKQELTAMMPGALVMYERIRALKQQYAFEYILVSDGAHGALLYEDGGNVGRSIPTRQVVAGDSTGAGDVLVAGMAAYIASHRNNDWFAASRYGVAAATAAVTRGFTPTVSACDVQQALGQQYYLAKVVSAATLQRLCVSANATNKRVVVTNGVFDILHAGHLAFLRWAARLGDIMVVLVNSDESATAVKGPGRPINTCARRMAVLAALPYVDAICSFAETTPEQILKEMPRCTLVKGSDYDTCDVVGGQIVRENGGAVVVMPKGDSTDECGTTEILSRLNAAAQSDKEGR